MLSALYQNFLGASPSWLKRCILAFLIINPLLLFALGEFVTGWVMILQFIFCLAMALHCYPLQSGGLIAIEAIALGLTSTSALYEEALSNFPVILLLIFMVAGISFIKDLLLAVFTRVLLGVSSKPLLALVFCASSALLSAFLDALTVTAVLIGVGLSFYGVYHRVASGKRFNALDHDHASDGHLKQLHRQELDQFRLFLQSLMMHGVVGTALGGVSTMVGEPQNLVIASQLDWGFVEFMQRMAVVSIPVILSGLVLCVILERLKVFGYGVACPNGVRIILHEFLLDSRQSRTPNDKAKLVIQALAALAVVLALALQFAEAGIIGLALIVVLTALNGITDEQQLGKAFTEALPFTALLVVFFTMVSMIHHLHLFTPMVEWVLALPKAEHPPFLFILNGLLSMISDNVFVATVYISEIKEAYELGHMSREEFETLAITINAGTNIPSVATPNGQAAFLFLLTSGIAPLIRLSYGRMIFMALPYTVVLSAVAFVSILLSS